MDFSDPYIIDYAAFMVEDLLTSQNYLSYFCILYSKVKRPDVLPPWRNITLPLNGVVWLCLLSTLILCFGFLHFLNRTMLNERCDPFILVALLLWQDSERHGKLWDGLRIFFLFFSLSTFVLAIGYQGALFSCLAIPVIPKPIGMGDCLITKLTN